VSVTEIFFANQLPLE